MAAGIFPWLGAVGSWLGSLSNSGSWGRVAAYAAMVISFLSSVGLAACLLQNDSESSPLLKASVWTLFNFQEPHPLTFVCGLEGTLPAAVRAAGAGVLFLATEWYFGRKRQNHVANDARLAHSLLYAAVIAYVYSPNLAQSLLSLAAIVLFGTTLWRLISEPVESRQQTGPLLRTSTTPDISALRRPQVTEFPQELSGRSMPQRRTASRQSLDGVTARGGEVWRALTFHWPNWLGEQLEVLLGAPAPVQALAVVTGVFAVLLTWLIIN